MKKICLSAAISLLIVLIGMFINYRAYQEDHYLKYSFKNHGGEITIEHGFGLQAVHIYTMEMGGHDSHRLRFDVISFLLFLAGTALIVYVILTICMFIANKRR
ncbi:MAG: hypothetical protein IKS51_00725 [Erysipelotrichaceae bacterium]|nr:hypothetical protein [Erysipelotrichaceae bacterium]